MTKIPERNKIKIEKELLDSNSEVVVTLGNSVE